MVPNADESSYNNQDDYEHKELGIGSISNNDPAEHSVNPAMDLPSEFELPAHNFGEV